MSYPDRRGTCSNILTSHAHAGQGLMDTKLYSTSTLGMFEQTRRAAQLDDIDLALASLQVTHK